MSKNTIILAIESSCDETAAAVIERVIGGFKVRSSVISTQVETHAKYGGIVPEIAARLQMEQMLPVITTALKEAGITSPQQALDAVAVTGGPGLITSLLVGVETAKSLAYAWEKPLLSINHIEGHVYSGLPFDKQSHLFSIDVPMPAIALIVSGGHTEIIYIPKFGTYELMGATRDDAVGEAFDKVAKMMGLSYPGGPIISKYAAQVSKSRFHLPRPMMHTGDFEMSFSGIKTAVLYRLNKVKKLTEQIKQEMAFEFQDAVTDVLVKKTVDAAKKLGVKSILLGGGVSANKVLRTQLMFEIQNQLDGVGLYTPEMSFAGDNAVMIGLAAHMHYINKDFTNPFGFRPDPQWELV